MAALLTAIGLTKTYGKGNTKVTALDDVSFAVERGTLTIILGPSGAGKSTLLNILGGMDKADSGVLAVDGSNVADYSQQKRAKYRRDKIGFVFQFYNLMPNLTAKENVELATEMRGDKAMDPVAILNKVGLGHRVNSFPSQLSGGEQQRVSIARALAKNSDLILCDEPTGALDYQTGKGILSILYNLVKEGKTIIIVTHNSALQEMGDHLIRIKNGKIVSDELNPHPKDIKDIEW